LKPRMSSHVTVAGYHERSVGRVKSGDNKVNEDNLLGDLSEPLDTTIADSRIFYKYLRLSGALFESLVYSTPGRAIVAHIMPVFEYYGSIQGSQYPFPCIFPPAKLFPNTAPLENIIWCKKPTFQLLPPPTRCTPCRLRRYHATHSFPRTWPHHRRRHRR
jgi:hypothetical protein